MNQSDQSNNQNKEPVIPWHMLFAISLESVLTPVDITVLSEVPIMSKTPHADILLLRNQHPHWTRAQRARLPDGIRDTRAAHILIEFKYTETLSERVYQKSDGL